MGEKKKILFIVTNFVQAGAQRYQYEVIKALDKDKFQVDIYALRQLGSMRSYGFDKEYYYSFLKKIANDIVFCNEIKGNFSILLRIIKSLHKHILSKKILTKDLSSKLVNFLEKENQKSLKNFFDNYDAINVTDYNYCEIKDIVNLQKLHVHVMTSKMQTFPKSPFDAFDYEKKYNFIVDWTPESQAFEFSEFKNGYNNIRFPLILDTTVINPIKYNPDNEPYKIGIFTRIDYQLKPLDPFFFALHLLVNQGMKIQLCIFGAGKPDGFNRLIKMLSLQDYVSFEGHQENLGDCLEKYKLNLVWFQANNYQPGGYAAHEIMLREMPNIFWDFQPLNRTKAQGQEPLPFFWNVEKFAFYTKYLLENAEAAKKLGEIQRQHVVDHQDSKRFIQLLEKVFDRE